MDQYIGEIDPGLMEFIDTQVIENIGLMELVFQMVHRLYQKRLEQITQEVAAANEDGQE
ncbi:hypothetical protein [Paenibacillus sp.]|jgi:hypothetical protein|uniref:hypothetical protein n=1 Tax=Paenibacillus sp. TaxID=58172 RepID=UPI00283A9D7E|nr:hypothetical protein [Paenibacillus sp.]